MKTALIAVVCVASGLALQEFPKALQYDFDPPVFPADSEGTVFMHFLPPVKGFAGNVNCMVQNFDGTIDAYSEISSQQFAAMGMDILNKKAEENILVLEYQGVQQGRELRGYSEARFIDGRVYLLTATALQSEWDTQGPPLIASVRSFKLK